jgi:hypothetical protein
MERERGSIGLQTGVCVVLSGGDVAYSMVLPVVIFV